MPQSVNIDLGSSLGKSLVVLVGYIPLKQDVIFFMSIEDLMDTGIWEETQLAILLCFLNLTWMCLHFKTPLFSQLQVDLLASIS